LRLFYLHPLFSGTQLGRKTGAGCISCLALRRRYSVWRQWLSLPVIHTFDCISKVLSKHEHANSKHPTHVSPYG
jgi:hypothetical protein